MSSLISPRRRDVFGLSAVALSALVSTRAVAQRPALPPTLIRNAHIFNGIAETLIEGMDVLIEGSVIRRIARGIDAPAGSAVIDAGGRTLTPGFIAAHEHLMMQMSAPELLTSDTRYFAYVATQTVRTYLMNGFTSVRDAAGNTFSLKTAIDRGIVAGPRIFPCGPMISQTSGHADHRLPAQGPALVGGQPSTLMAYGDMAVVDGVPEVLKAVRESMRMGATQIKIAVGGGTGSYADPLDVIEFTAEEIRAAVQAAEDFQTYVMAHVYNPPGIRRAVENGVKSIEHGNLIDEPTMRIVQESGAWLSSQVIVYTFIPNGYTEDQAAKHREAYAGIDNMFTIAKRIGFDRIAFGTDIITDPATTARMNEEFVLRTRWFTPFEVLRQATAYSGALLGLSRRYSPGKLGVIEEGALADILLINGDPLRDISILTKAEESLALIMKGGMIHKNLLR